MAKKRRRRSGSGSRPGGRAGTSTQDRVEASSVKPAPATPGGPNRLERKEQARRQREALRRRIARRRFLRRSGLWLGAAVIVAAVILLIVRASRPHELNAEESRLLSAAPAAAQAAGCGKVETVKPYDPESQDRQHIGAAGAPPTPPPLSSYPTQPPTSGPHNVAPLGAGEYPDPPAVDQTIHSLEHGAVVIWYDPSALTSKELTDLQTFFNKPRERGKVIIAPYNYTDQGPAGKLAAGKQMAMVAWRRMQTCNKVSLPVAFQFVYHYDTGFGPGDYRGEAPETGAPI